MDVRLLEGDDQPQAMALWKEAFGDTDAFIGWYFDNKIQPGGSLGVFDGDTLVSALHMIPYTICVQGQPLPTAFVAGAATLKKRRGQGHMRTLLRELLGLLKSRGIPITHLHPFNHAFYEKFGWAAYSHVSRQTVTAAPYRHSADVVETHDILILRTLYERMMRGYDGYVVRGEREWGWRLGELAADGGQAAVLLKDGCARAYMLYHGVGDMAQVVETVYTAEEDIGSLLGYLFGLGYGSAEYTVPDQGKGAAAFNMARVVDTPALLSALGAGALLDQLDITDDFAEWNNTAGGRGTALDVAALAALVHCGADRKTSESVGRLFAPRRACIFETY